MNQNVYLKQYKKNNVETATPEDRFMMLFNGLINFILKAKKALEENNIQEKHNNIIKAQNILYEFINTLNYDENAELANSLRSLYEYNINLLFKANIKKDMAALEESLKLLQGMRDTWQKAVNIFKQEQKKALEEAGQIGCEFDG